MRYYVKAYQDDGTEVLGNTDGQLSWEGRFYRRTAWYKNLKWLYTLKDIAYYLITTKDGKVIERVDRERPNSP